MATEQKAQTGAELFGRAMFDPSSRIYETVDPNYMMTVSGELASPDFQIKGYSGEDNIARAYGTTPPLPFGFAASVEVEIKVKDQGGREEGRPCVPGPNRRRRPHLTESLGTGYSFHRGVRAARSVQDGPEELHLPALGARP